MQNSFLKAKSYQKTWSKSKFFQYKTEDKSDHQQAKSLMAKSF